MSGFRPDFMAERAVQRMRDATDDDTRAAMGNYGATMTKGQLVVVIGTLARVVLEQQRTRR